MRASTKVTGMVVLGLGVLPAVAGANAIEMLAWAEVGTWRIECVRAEEPSSICEMFAIVTVEAEPGPRDVILQFSPGDEGPGQTVAIVADELGFDAPPSGISVDGREILSLAVPSADIRCAGRVCQIDGVSAGLVVAAAGMGSRLVVTGIDGQGRTVEFPFELDDFNEGYRLWRRMQIDYTQ